jgi:HTH-type transcriptional regulator / antitoxin HigA
MNRVIRSEIDYDAALSQIELLIDQEAAPGTPEGEELELLTVLVRNYEANRFGEGIPDPIEAIKFRMEQADLKPRDLIPFIGSRSKVSEVLSRKRSLTLSMIKALHAGLGIPAGALLREGAAPDLGDVFEDWNRFPVREMLKRGWIAENIADSETGNEEILRRYFDRLGADREALVLYRRTAHIRAGRQMDKYAVTSWTAQIMICATENPPPTKYAAGTVDLKLMQELVRLSIFESGPRLAQEFLGKHGISLVIEPHLSGTYLDGAAVLIHDARPVIGLTLRHDRIDNFWFCLMHELAHVALHFDQKFSQFYDDLDVDAGADSPEREADQMAGEALIPEGEWRKSPASRLRSPEAVLDLARRLRIHPAIVAGRIRHQFKSFRVLNQFVGYGQVRRLFPEFEWDVGASNV